MNVCAGIEESFELGRVFGEHVRQPYGAANEDGNQIESRGKVCRYSTGMIQGSAGPDDILQPCVVNTAGTLRALPARLLHFLGLCAVS